MSCVIRFRLLYSGFESDVFCLVDELVVTPFIPIICAVLIFFVHCALFVNVYFFVLSTKRYAHHANTSGLVIKDEAKILIQIQYSTIRWFLTCARKISE